MVGKSARFLAPIALVAVAFGVYVIVHSTLVHDGASSAATTTSSVVDSHHRRAHHRRRTPKFYVVKAGDTLSEIASRTGISIVRLTKLNPALSAAPNSLQTGQHLRLRR